MTISANTISGLIADEGDEVIAHRTAGGNELVFHAAPPDDILFPKNETRLALARPHRTVTRFLLTRSDSQT